MSIRIRRIDCTQTDAAAVTAEIRRLLNPDGEVISERGREVTQRLFGEALSPAASVARICTDVRSRGFVAVQHYSRELDRFDLTADNVRVTEEELAEAHRAASPDYLDAVRRVRRNIEVFQTGILHRSAAYKVDAGQEIRLRYRPVRRVGVCVPGGAAAYPSTLLMTVVPAQVAGVRDIAVMAPPTRFGSYNRDLLAACREIGVTEVYRIGGAHGVAALAHGVDGIPAVDMIVGPGNLFVALAKRFVFGQVGIDLLAGPSEIAVLADGTANAAYVASDLIAQAEHSPGASFLITPDARLLATVDDQLREQVTMLPRGELAQESLEKFGALILVADLDQGVDLVNAIAPEHVHVCTVDGDAVADRIDHAGAVFIGSYSPVALGDYAAGPSHVLPTGGTARFASGLSANDFLRRSSVIKVTRDGLEKHAADVCLLANKEGLTGHSRSVEIRFDSTF